MHTCICGWIVLICFVFHSEIQPQSGEKLMLPVTSGCFFFNLYPPKKIVFLLSLLVEGTFFTLKKTGLVLCTYEIPATCSLWFWLSQC